MNINLRQLEYFVESVNFGSFTEASKHLYVTPQAVSKSLMDLESCLDIQLFEKSGRNIHFTDNAMTLVEMARNILYLIDEMEDFAKRRSLESKAFGLVKLAIVSAPYRGGCLLRNRFRLLS